MKKAYQKPEVRIVNMEQELYLMRGSTFENYAKSNDFFEVENDEDSNDGLHYTQPNNCDFWADEDEEQ